MCAQLKYSKYHALGNDYLVIVPQDSTFELNSEKIKRICHRNFGIGSDGILFGPLPSDNARFGLRIFNQTFTFCAATIGNPHCVIQLPEITPEVAKQYGSLLEVHRYFPKRTNVQFMKVLDRGNIQIEIWERGAGYTLASGSSSSAAAAVARKLGLCDSAITVHMQGGQIAIEISDDFMVTMTGAVTKVAEGLMSAEIFEY